MPTGGVCGLPVIRGLIERRILINYHVDPGVVARILPACALIPELVLPAW